jgi:hypothetical protein
VVSPASAHLPARPIADRSASNRLLFDGGMRHQTASLLLAATLLLFGCSTNDGSVTAESMTP